MTLVPQFPPDYAGAIVVPANLDNVYSVAGHGGVPNKPRAFIIHTPEEAADNIEVTPRWFQQYHPDSRGSTHYYLDNDGDVYQCVPESWGAIANGFNPGIPQRVSYPAWAAPHSLNWQTISVEIEGRAHSIGLTLNQVQFDALVKLVRHRCQFYGIPLDREHVMGHYQLAYDRTDPGASFPWARFIDALQPEEDEMRSFLCWDTTNKRVMFVGPDGPKWITSNSVKAELEKQFGPMTVALSAEALKALGAA